MSTVLITGADGHVGRSIGTTLLDTTEQRLLLWVRASDESGLQKKRESLAALLSDPRCELAAGDLTEESPFRNVDPSAITHILHSAAVTRFSVEKSLAQQTNVDGSRKLFEFARQCHRLERMVLLSSLYVTGLRTGVIDEELLEEAPDYANHYEWSKWKAEQLLVDEYSELPWQIHRIATVLAKDNGGTVSQYNVIHNTLRLFYYGLLSVMPGQAETRVYATTTDFAATASAGLAMGGPAHTVFHVSDNPAQALSISETLDIVYESFCRDRYFKNLRIKKPLFCDWAAFATLLEGAEQFSSVLNQSLSSVAPFARQLYKDKTYSNRNLTAALPDTVVPNTAEILPRVCEHLVSCRWGLKEAPADD